ncbi:MAG: glycosyltransferase family 9 protein [Elusimicrobia bacterium]|nr:glycosyltransferase family 9 protein [Elusimicrobiota bacterium]
MEEPRSILVIQLRRIGDVILTTPALAALKARYPQARIDFLVEPPCDEVLEGNPHLGRVHSYRARGIFGALSWVRRVRLLGYDWVIDYMGNPRSALVTALSGARVKAGPGHVAHRWAYNHRLIQSPTPHYAAEEKIRMLATLGVDGRNADFLPHLAFSRGTAENMVGLIPASRRATRRWPAVHYARLGRLLRDRFGSRIMVFWGPGERALADEVAAGVGEGAETSPETPGLKDLAGLVGKCRLIVTNCNGPKHLAVAMGVPTLTVHGSSDPRSWNPPHPRHRFLRRDELFCIGCGLNSCPYHLECLEGLPPERVFASACALLEEGA